MNTSTAIEIESRVLNEGYGPGAWHGADLKAALADAKRFNLVLGITRHAIYHAGQIQLIDRLRGE